MRWEFRGTEYGGVNTGPRIVEKVFIGSISDGDLLNAEQSGEETRVERATAASTKLIGIAHQWTGGKAAQRSGRIRVVINTDAIYGVSDRTPRRAGDLLKLNAEGTALVSATETDAQFEVVAPSNLGTTEVRFHPRAALLDSYSSG